MKKQHKTVSVLAAVYRPNIKWFEQLLRSIQSQDYKDYEVLIMDDCSGQAEFEGISEAVHRIFGSRPDVRLFASPHNEGSNRTFEKLALLAEGDYLAFCDQDDIWEPEKLSMLVAGIRKRDAVLAYSDMSVIDENGEVLYSSIRGMRRYLEFVSGEHLASKYIMDNCTAACSMLVKRKCVLNAIPFYEGACCDQWICASAAASGRIVFLNIPLVRYRRHGGNQTGMLHQIKSRQDYYEKRVLAACCFAEEMKKRGIHYRYESDIEAFAQARKHKDILKIWKYRRFSRKYAYFDILMTFLPEKAAAWIFKNLHRRNSACCLSALDFGKLGHQEKK